MPSVFFAAFKVWRSFFGDLHGRLDLEVVPKLFYFSTVRRVFAFVVLLPPSTADVVCPRFVHTDEPCGVFEPCRGFPSSRFHLALFYALDDNIDASRVISIRLREA